MRNVQIKTHRRFLSTAIASGTLRVLILAIWSLALAGCARRPYADHLLPTFMHEESPAGAPPPIEGQAACCPCGSDTGGQAASGTPDASAKTLPTPEQVVAHTSQESAGVVQAQAIEELSAPSPLPISGITLDQAIAESLRADPKLRAGWEAIRQAHADLITSGLPPNPTLTVNAVFLPFRPFTPARPGGPPELDYIAGFPVDWFLFGKQAAAVADAQLNIDVSAADYADLVRQRVAGTVAAFYDVLEAQAMLNLASEDLASLKRVEGITRQRANLGGVGTIEVDRMRLSVLDSQRDVRNREATLLTAKARLRASLGKEHGDPAFDVAGSLDVPNPAALLRIEEAVALADENRPDIISLRRQIDRARSGVCVETTKAYPAITPSAGLTRQYQTDIGVPDASSCSLSVNVVVPLFDRNQGNISKSKSALVQSVFNLQSQLVQLRADVEQAGAEFAAARADVTSIGPEQLQAAKSVRDRTEGAYKAGGKTLLEVIDAERAYRDTHRSYIMGQSAYWHSLERLNAALGKQVLR